jgi:hypothetical protein
MTVTELPVEKPFFQSEDKPEASKWYQGEERMSAAEWLRRKYGPGMLPKTDELHDVRGTMARFGQIARSKGTSQRHNLAVVRLYHPDYPEGVNGWTDMVWKDAWTSMTRRYPIEWEITPPEPKEIPDQPQREEFAGALLDTILSAVESRHPSYRSDVRWQAAKRVLDQDPRTRLLGESPEEALIRRQSASAMMFAIEKEYEGR